MAHSKLTTNFQFVHVVKISYGIFETTSICGSPGSPG